MFTAVRCSLRDSHWLDVIPDESCLSEVTEVAKKILIEFMGLPFPSRRLSESNACSTTLFKVSDVLNLAGCMDVGSLDRAIPGASQSKQINEAALLNLEK
jgi:hypothetical protein